MIFSILPPSWGGPTKPTYGTPPYTAYNPQKVADNTPGAPNLPSDDPSSLLSQVKDLWSIITGSGGSGSRSLDYSLYTPQEQAQRGLALNASKYGALGAEGAAFDAHGQALDAQGNYIQSQVGNVGNHSAANILKNQIAGQAFAAQRDKALQQALIDRHNAQGQFASQGSISSEAARQTLGNKGNELYYAQNGNKVDGMSNPWQGNGQGDIQNALTYNLGDIYRQTQSTQADFSTAQGDLYNQLVGLGAQNADLGASRADLSASRAGLGPQYLQLGQQSDAFNRLLNNQVNTKVSPEMRALFSALSQAT